MSEYLVESGKGGAVAAVAYNPCGVNSTSQILAKEVLDDVFIRGERCLGRAVFAAKCSVIARYPTNDNLYGPAVLWTIFGDPALRVRHRGLTGVAERPQPVASVPDLDVRPSPARMNLSVVYSTASAGPVSLRLYDESGALVRTLLSGPASPGTYQLRIPCSDLNPGVYFVKLEAGRACFARRVAVVR